MPTDLLPTRADPQGREKTSSGLVLAILLHVLVAIAVGIAAWLSHRAAHRFGDRDPVAGSIQASMVNALPLPPRQPTVDRAVLASEKSSLAPTPPPPTPEPPRAKTAPAPVKSEPIPKPNEVLLPKKVVPAKPSPVEKETPAPPRHIPPPTTPPPPNKATTGETSGMQIPQSISQLKNGTASITVEERAFGDRYAYYVRLISQKVNQAWQQEQSAASASASNGRRTTVTFTIERDGSVSDEHVTKKSGSPTLDMAAERSIQRIDTFGPLPQGNELTVDFSFDFHADHQ